MDRQLQNRTSPPMFDMGEHLRYQPPNELSDFNLTAFSYVQSLVRALGGVSLARDGG
jgi:hypothetical protein